MLVRLNQNGLRTQYGIAPAAGKLESVNRNMKTFEAISEAVRNPKYLFRKTENQPKKPQKHRYERRKIKEYLHLTDWLTESIG